MGRAFDPTLYVITSERIAAGRDQVTIVDEAIGGGATMVQLRDKELPARDLYALGLRLRELTRARGVPLICDDRLDLALAIDADGVHLGQDDLPPRVARELLGGRIVGLSVGSPDEMALARGGEPDYLGTGPFAATGSKADAGREIGAAGLAAVRALTDLPIVAIGGITAANAVGAIAAGADGVAVISSVIGAEDPRAAAASIRAAIDGARRRR